MTIAAALLTPDGVVLGTDSAVTILAVDEDDKPVVTSVLTGTQKLFQLGLQRPVAFAFFNDAEFGSRSYRDLLTEFDAHLADRRPEIATEMPGVFLEFAEAKWQEELTALGLPAGTPLPDTGVIVAGHGEGERRCSYACMYLRDEPARERIEVVTEPGQLIFQGSPQAVERLVYGIDKSVVDLLANEGILGPGQASAIEEAVTGPNPLRFAPHPSLPLRDAIDYVHFLVFASIKFFKFLDGPPPCGGKIELACITTDRGFRWVTHKSLDWCVNDSEAQTEYSPLDPHGHGR